MKNSVESITNIKFVTKVDYSEDNNDLFIAGYNSVLSNSDSRAARDYYLLLMVYVNYFCVPIFSFTLKSLCALQKNVRDKISEIMRVTEIVTTFVVEDKKYIKVLLPFSRIKQVEYTFISERIYRKTVLL